MAASDEQLIDTLRQQSHEFRLIESRHSDLSRQLDQLIRHHVLTPDEEVLKKRLQKQKLAAKDQMIRMIRRHEDDELRLNGRAGRRASPSTHSGGP